MTKDRFKQTLHAILDWAEVNGHQYVDMTAGKLHRSVGGYPGTGHRMPMCCGVMRDEMGPKDLIISQPQKGNGATFDVRYNLPRALSS